MVEFKRRPSLEQIVDALTVGWVDADGDRRCSLFEELRELVIPAQQMVRDGAGSMGKRTGSPAPWFAPAAELIDEVERGAVRFDAEARHVLGLETDMRVGWCAALDGLPGLVESLARAGHPLGVREDASLVASDGIIETQVRAWHRRALVMVGDAQPVERLPTVANPDHPRHGGRPRLGPVCRSCSHASCDRIATAHRRSLTFRCPDCGCDSLRRDPAANDVVCVRPSCRNSEGGRSVWHVTDFDEGSLDPWGDRVDPAR